MTLPKLLDNSGNEVRRLNPVELSITEQIIPLSTATMSLAKEQAIPDRSWVELFTPNGSAGVYRTRTPSDDYGSLVYTYTLEHAVCEVGDWLVRSNISNTRKKLSAAFTQIFAYYGGTKWQLGTVPDDYVVLSANYSNLLQTMNSLIEQVKGAYMTFDFTTTPWTINVASVSSTVSAEGRLSRNIQSVTVQRDDSNLCTRVWLKGLSSTASQSYMDSDTKDTYGIIEKRLSDSDYTRTQAQTVAAAYLERYKNPLYTVDINGNDFSSITGETLDRIAIGKLYRLVIPEENVTLSQPIVTIVWEDLVNNETSVSITLSEPETTIVNTISRRYSDYYGAGGDYEQQEAKNNRFSSDIQIADDRIALVIDDNGIRAAQIVLAINDRNTHAQSFVAIDADQVDISGSVVVSTLVDDFSDLTDGTLLCDILSTENLWAYNIYVADDFYITNHSKTAILYTLSVQDITINGTTYHVFTGV